MELETKGKLMMNEPLSFHNSLHIGGKAKYFLNAADKDDVFNAKVFAEEEGFPFLIMGKGSNMLFSDKGFSGIVISTGNMKKINIKDTKMIAQAGVSLSELIEFSKEFSLSGLESLVGIPGSVGGASVMNAGAFGCEIGEYIETAIVLRNGMEVKIEDMRFGYRESSLSDEIVLGLEFLMKKKEKKYIEEKISETIEMRRKKQPMFSKKKGTCGSVFKNPEGYSAGELIEKSGFRGTNIGGVRVSKKHCNYFLTDSGATSEGFMELVKRIRDKVKKNFGITLELEVKVIGKEKEIRI